MDGDVVFAFMVGGGVVCFHWFVRPVKEVEGALLFLSIPGGDKCWLLDFREQAIDIHELSKL